MTTMMRKRPWPRTLPGSVLCVLSLGLLGVLLDPNPAEARPFAYVSGAVASGPDFIPRTVVIDTATDAVIATIAAGTGRVALTPDRARAQGGCGYKAVAGIDPAPLTGIR